MNTKTDRISIIYNPVAGGGGSYKKIKRLFALLEDSGVKVKLYSTKKGNQPISELYLMEVIKSGKVIIAGGDGSLNKLVNQVYDYLGNELFDCEFAVFPIGSGNDWARAYGFSPKPKRWFSTFMEGKTAEASLAEIEIKNEGQAYKMFALNSVGIGVTGEIMKRLHKGRSKNPSKAAYLATTLISFYHYDYPEFTINIDEHARKLKMLTANLGLNKTTGGGMCLFPQNKKGMGLGLTVVHKPKLTLVPSLLWQLYFGNISKVKKTVDCYQPESVLVSCNNEQCIEIDGEMHSFISYSARLYSRKLKVFGVGKK